MSAATQAGSKGEKVTQQQEGRGLSGPAVKAKWHLLRLHEVPLTTSTPRNSGVACEQPGRWLHLSLPAQAGEQKVLGLCHRRVTPAGFTLLTDTFNSPRYKAEKLKSGLTAYLLSTWQSSFIPEARFER